MKLLLFWLAAALALPALADSYEGIVSHVTDGDTLWIRPAGGGAPRQLRIEGIDAPEICQSWGTQARDALAARVLHKRVAVSTTAQDSFDRPIGQVQLKGKNVGQWMVSRGHAWSYRFHKDKGPYARQERAAQRKAAGLWSAARPVEPRVFRKQHGACER